ncbi:hypothetical protein BASA81_000629 [Batrachochytrium salamandrivorans]|nr:hypothetical protein BASA81_000629 [Batrachochytrium salamandrivorans]
MLFLYRVQNDLFETPSFNALELEGSTLAAFVLAVSQLFGLPGGFSHAFQLRVRKSDPKFGYVWKDVPVGSSELDQQLEGDTVLLRLVRLSTLQPGNTKTPVLLSARVGLPSGIAKPQPLTAGGGAEKRKAATVAASEPVQAKKTVPVVAAPAIPAAELARKDDNDSDGSTAEERAQKRIEERNRQELEDQQRKVEEMRSADLATSSQADARVAAWQELRPSLEKWSNNPGGGEKKPIRALLSTLHTVLWEGSRWTQAALLVRPNEVRLSFRKAMLVVHPDKIANNSPANVQVIAKYCFECLNTAYDKFEQQELK